MVNYYNTIPGFQSDLLSVNNPDMASCYNTQKTCKVKEVQKIRHCQYLNISFINSLEGPVINV